MNIELSNKSSQLNLGFVEKEEELPTENATQISDCKNQDESEFKHMEEYASNETPPGGYGWLVLLCATLYFGFTLSMWTNFTLIYPKLILEYQATEKYNVTFSAWIGSFSLGIAFLTSFLSSFLVDFFGCVKIGFAGGLVGAIGLIGSAICLTFKAPISFLFLTYGLVFGIGQSMMMAVPFAILPHYFQKKLGFVTGILNTGASVILIGYSYLIGYFFDNFRIEIVFYMLAGSSILLSVLSFVFKSQIPNDRSSLSLRNKLFDSLGLEILKSPKFIIWTASMMLGVIAYSYIIASLAYALGTLMIRYIENFYVYCVIILIFGIFDALFLVSLLPMASEVAGGSSKLVNQAMGFFNSFISLSIVFGPTISGYYFQKYNNYLVSYNITIGTLLATSLILAFYPDILVVKLVKYLRSKFLPGVVHRF